MAVVANSLGVRGSLVWSYTKAVTGFTAAEQRGDVSFSMAPSATTYNHVYFTQFSLAAAASQTVDVYSFTSVLGESVTATKALGLAVKATATVTGGQLKIEPGATNPLEWILSGTTPAITLDVGTAGCGLLFCEGVTEVVSATVRNIKFSNPGTQTITVTLAVIVGA